MTMSVDVIRNWTIEENDYGKVIRVEEGKDLQCTDWLSDKLSEVMDFMVEEFGIQEESIYALLPYTHSYIYYNETIGEDEPISVLERLYEGFKVAYTNNLEKIASIKSSLKENKSDLRDRILWLIEKWEQGYFIYFSD